MGRSSFLRYLPRVGAAVVLFTFAVYTAHVGLGLGGASTNGFFNDFVYNGLELSAAAACLLRAGLVREGRLPWLVMGFGLLCWAGGDIYWTLFLADKNSPPIPSPADALYLVFYPASYITIVSLVRTRVAAFRPSLWLDGAIAATAVAASATALAFQPILDTTSGSTAAVATNLAYPIGDITLLAAVVAVFGLSGWRPGRAWILIGAGLALGGLADVIYLVQSAKGTYQEGTILDALWPASLMLIGLAAWQPARIRQEASLEGRRAVMIPVLAGLVALGLTTYDHFEPLSTPAWTLTAATLLLVCARLALAFAENQRMLATSRHESLTDSLTGLRNRRALMADLDREVGGAGPGDPRIVVLFDLDGFKLYNDTFGHVAGDALLARLGQRLGEAAAPYGRAYRLGGDEFCALIRPGKVGLEPILAGTSAALSAEGPGFSVVTSSGAVLVPSEATGSSEALQLADRRMYAQKGGRGSSPARQSRDVLLSTLRERQPDLHNHLTDVAVLALVVGRSLGMSPEELDELARTAELHDVGKVAIPDAILNKPGPLVEAEWSFMQRHTVIGERILMAAPALTPVARLVRSTHERWDGRGYPDGLAGEEIPLGARIVAVCDAYDAMTADRPYRDALDEQEALVELRRCAGTQFDPTVVEEFCRAHDERRLRAVTPA